MVYPRRSGLRLAPEPAEGFRMIEIVVTPTKKPGRFEARLAGAVLVASSRTPFFTAARADRARPAASPSRGCLDF
jgi:hypothetical protein